MKKFIKNNLKIISAFILGGIFFGGTVYAATTILANDVLYKETNVESALDDLYNNMNKFNELVIHGTVNSYSTSYSNGQILIYNFADKYKYFSIVKNTCKAIYYWTESSGGFVATLNTEYLVYSTPTKITGVYAEMTNGLCEYSIKLYNK